MKEMAKVPHLTRVGGQWIFRRAVPAELRGIVGKREIKHRLGHDYERAVEACRLHGVEADNLFRQTRQELKNTILTAPTETQLRQIVLAWFHQREREAIRLGQQQQLTRQQIDNALSVCDEDEAQWSDPDMSRTHSEEAADEILRTNLVRLDEDSEAYRYLCEWVKRGELELIRRSRKRLLGDFTMDNLDPAFAEITAERGAPRKKQSLTLTQLIDRYTNDPKRVDLAPRTVLAYRIKFDAFKELFGPDKSIAEIEREDCRDVMADLMAMPPNAVKRFPGRSLKEAIKIAKVETLETVSSKTVNTYMQLLSGLFKWAVDEQYLDSNPASGLRVGGAGARPSRKDRDPFSTDQLQKIFCSTIYTGSQEDDSGWGNDWHKPGENIPPGARFWLPLVALYSGLRQNELCQLFTDDVTIRDGVPVVLVIEDEDGEKRLKNPNAARIVPVHPELTALGFLDYVKAMKDREEERLFPQLTRDRYGHYSTRLQKWFPRLLERAEATAPKTNFHSFRHNFTDALREAEVSDDVMKSLLGWSRDGMDGIYGSGLKSQILAREIAKVRYEGLDLLSLRKR